jgi:hypothetical protein
LCVRCFVFEEEEVVPMRPPFGLTIAPVTYLGLLASWGCWYLAGGVKMTCNKFLQNRPKKRNPTQKQPTDSTFFFFFFRGPLNVRIPALDVRSGMPLCQVCFPIFFKMVFLSSRPVLGPLMWPISHRQLELVVHGGPGGPITITRAALVPSTQYWP